MKKFQYFLFCVLIAFSISCSNNSDFVATYKFDIEGKSDWINTNTIGKFGGATGEYCSKVDSINVYSYGLNKLLSEISPNTIKRIDVSVYVKLAKLDKKSLLVISIKGPNNENIFWTGHELNPVTKEINKWYKFYVEDALPEDYKSEGATVGVYVWNPNKNVIYVDDFDIRFH